MVGPNCQVTCYAFGLKAAEIVQTLWNKPGGNKAVHLYINKNVVWVPCTPRKCIVGDIELYSLGSVMVIGVRLIVGNTRMASSQSALFVA